jgi:hypothetical protein
MSWVIKTRQDDEELLAVLAMRARYGAAPTARALGVPSERVRALCNRVLQDDMKASLIGGVETAEQVASGYWGTQ